MRMTRNLKACVIPDGMGVSEGSARLRCSVRKVSMCSCSFVGHCCRDNPGFTLVHHHGLQACRCSDFPPFVCELFLQVGFIGVMSSDLFDLFRT